MSYLSRLIAKETPLEITHQVVDAWFEGVEELSELAEFGVSLTRRGHLDGLEIFFERLHKHFQKEVDEHEAHENPVPVEIQPIAIPEVDPNTAIIASDTPPKK